MTKTLKDLNLALLDFKRHVNHGELYYYTGFHMVITDGIKHLLKLLHRTSQSVVVIDMNNEVNESQLYLENCFEEICKILLNLLMTHLRLIPLKIDPLTLPKLSINF